MVPPTPSTAFETALARAVPPVFITPLIPSGLYDATTRNLAMAASSRWARRRVLSRRGSLSTGARRGVGQQVAHRLVVGPGERDEPGDEQGLARRGRLGRDHRRGERGTERAEHPGAGTGGG